MKAMNSKSDIIPVKRCRVCGDKAISFNFNAISCESCKSFFRRNALKRDKFECVLSNQKCEIDMQTRMFCKRCRLDKCIAVGMRQKSSRSRQLKEDTSSDSDIKLEKIVDSEEVSLTLKKFESHSKSDLHDLATEQMFILREVENAMKSIYGIGVRYDVILGEAQDLVHVLNLSAFDISKTIRFCKSLQAFNALKSDDQLTLLKSFYPSKYCVKVSHLYNLDKEGWIELSGENDRKGFLVKMEVFQQCKQDNFFSMFRAFITSLHLEMENDTSIRDLVLAQQLFKPSKSYRISSPEYARFYHIQYRYLLRRYLEHKYQSQHRAERKYTSLIHLIGQLDFVAEAVRNLYAKVEPDQLCEILVEMFLH